MFEGENIANISRERFAKMISYVPQNLNTSYGDLKVKDYLILGRNPYILLGNPRKSDYDLVETYSMRTGIQELLNIPFRHLSGGQKQWVAITRALVQETPVILMDEPMAALDMGKQAVLLALLDELRSDDEKTIILTSHNPNHCMMLESTVCLLHENKIYSIGKPIEVFSETNVNAIYGNNIKVYNHEYIGFSRIAKNVDKRKIEV